ncbi:PucR family transcriptional regulator [Gordonia sp. zg691]|uniref:PucR family transcriptional regulator n=1 Tax=Gordonia jinghuaiqii TaxID=2758710 RepID=A0A7D7QP74_9ACTN|nr:PucR family transcriptional regulator [Gordonia jinghuaiqii]MBD0860389.1 PucR family transcriptional regulator [Gordonia jinghuaiqii]MCR5978341.1 hypothetical protein [Gordonia jinghuaiqii]QMT01226.1 PucR family transcriptional regulator [Gordonia jinghuaiqii]
MTNPAAMPYGRSPTLTRLLAESDLELRLLSGRPERVDRVMAGIHLTEVLDVDKWLAEGWVMMTTGVLLQRDPQAQRMLIRTLDSIDATGLGYCVDIVTRHVPAALLDEARRLNFPLFAMPLHIKARDVATRANRMILANDDTLFQQAQSTQDLFFENFDIGTAPEWLPERQLVSNLSAFLGLPVRFHANDGLLGSGSDPIGRILLTAPTHAPIKQRSGDDDLLIVPARVGAIFVGWVVVTVPREISDGQVALNTTIAVARLVALAVVSRKRPASSDRAVRQEVMGQLLSRGRASGSGGGDDPMRRLESAGTLSALQDLGFRPGEAVRGSVVDRVADNDRDARRPGFDAVIEALHRSAAPYAFLTTETTLTVMTQMPIEDLVAVLGGVDGYAVGIGAEVPGVVDLRRSVEQARSALDMSVPVAGSPARSRCVVFDDVPLSAWMIHHHSGAKERAARELSTLREHPAVFETVVVWFEVGMDVTRCAERLFIHANSVRYRLNKAEEYLHASLHDPAVIADLYLAMRVCGDL